MEADVGLDPGIPGSPPEPKADAQLLSHTGIPIKYIIKIVFTYFLLFF